MENTDKTVDQRPGEILGTTIRERKKKSGPMKRAQVSLYEVKEKAVVLSFFWRRGSISPGGVGKG